MNVTTTAAVEYYNLVVDHKDDDNDVEMIMRWM